MRHFFFGELISGDEFIVCADTLKDAYDIAEDIWEDAFESVIKFYYEMTEEEAEASGLDEY